MTPTKDDLLGWRQRLVRWLLAYFDGKADALAGRPCRGDQPPHYGRGYHGTLARIRRDASAAERSGPGG